MLSLFWNLTFLLDQLKLFVEMKVMKRTHRPLNVLLVSVALTSNLSPSNSYTGAPNPPGLPRLAARKTLFSLRLLLLRRIRALCLDRFYKRSSECGSLLNSSIKRRGCCQGQRRLPRLSGRLVHSGNSSCSSAHQHHLNRRSWSRHSHICRKQLTMNGIGKAIDYRLKLRGHAVDIHGDPSTMPSALSILSASSARSSV